MFVFSLGGDTDTNACIVGGMIGALVGVENLPELYLRNLIKCNTKGGYHERREMYHPYKSILVA